MVRISGTTAFPWVRHTPCRTDRTWHSAAHASFSRVTRGRLASVVAVLTAFAWQPSDRLATPTDMSFIKIAAVVGPLVGVVIGFLLNQAGSRRNFGRDFGVQMLRDRQERYREFAQALWAYAARVLTLRTLAADKTGRLLDPAHLGPIPTRYDYVLTKERQERLRDAAVGVRLYGSHSAELAAFAAMEALTACHNAATEFDLDTAAAHFGTYERLQREFWEAVGGDIEQFNALLYAHYTSAVTRLWHRLTKQEPEFSVSLQEPPTPSTGTDTFATTE